MRKIYKGFDTRHNIEPTMWREILRIINEATVDGLSQGKVPVHEDDFLSALRHSNEVFAAMKTHQMGEDMAKKLLDSHGKLKPFAQWRNDVSSIARHHVGAWLKTEYNTAVIRAHAAADWREFERNKDILPNLRWMPTTSAEPDSAHKVYWQMKLTLPVDDPFWNDHHPGDRWNCKCSLEATDEPEVRPAELKYTKPQRGLESNPGKTAEMFSNTHPYYPNSCNSCPFNKGFKNKAASFFTNEVKHCNECSKIDAVINDDEKKNILKAKELISNVEETHIARKEAAKIYSFTQSEIAAVKNHGIELESTDVYISDNRILHALRSFKESKGKAVSMDELKNFIDNVYTCDMLFDEEKKNIVFVTNQNGKTQKFVIEPNYKLKANGEKIITNAFVTAGLVKEHNMRETKYKKIR